MSVLESVPYALFVMAVVFGVLIILSICIKLFSFVISPFTGKAKNSAPAEPHPVSADAATSSAVTEAEPEAELSCGELKLIHVDERTAAMIMAIVCDETDIPLEELCFKSIKAIN